MHSFSKLIVQIAKILSICHTALTVTFLDPGFGTVYAANTHLAYKLQMNIHRWHKIPKQMVYPNIDVGEILRVPCWLSFVSTWSGTQNFSANTFRLMPLPSA